MKIYLKTDNSTDTEDLPPTDNSTGYLPPANNSTESIISGFLQKKTKSNNKHSMTIPMISIKRILITKTIMR